MREGSERSIARSEDDHTTFVMDGTVKRLHLKMKKAGM